MSASQPPSSGGPLPSILLLADPLAGAGIQRWLTTDPPLYRLLERSDPREGHPRLVIWALTSQPPAAALLEELRQLQERWHPAPVLLLVSEIGRAHV